MSDDYNQEQYIKIKTKGKISTHREPMRKERLNNRPKKNLKKKFFFISIFVLTLLVVFSSQVIVSEQSSSSWLSHLPIIKQIKYLAESAARNLKGESEDRINILLLGMGGVRHEGGYLTDTIILASLEPSSKKVSMISIPRDLALPVEDMGLQKINSINAYAEAEAKDSGGLAISQAISDVLNIPIHYYVRVDFTGFINIIDLLDGVDINVSSALDDYRYPIMGREEAEDYESRFEHLHIDPGWQHMDGELALKYARSRHALGGQGSDFSRSRRQQKIIIAVKNKLLSRYTLFHPTTITKIIDEYQDHVSTNLKVWEMLKLWDLFKDISNDNIVNKILDNSPNGLLVEGYNDIGSYILTPRSGDFAEIQYFINNIFSDAPAEEKDLVSNERTTIEVRNGTWINGLASKTALDLEKYGFIVVRIGNSSRQNFEKSVIYDLTYGEKSESLTILKDRIDANVSYSLPEWLVSDIQNELTAENNPIQPDFIIIIGRDMDKTESGTVNTEEEMIEE